MADPDANPTLTSYDRGTVRLYRVGIALGAAGMLCMAASYPVHSLPWHVQGRLLLAAGATLSAWNLHLYDRWLRWVFAGLAWSALLSMAWSSNYGGAPGWLLRELGIGLHLAFFAAVAMKEQRCFKVPLMQAVPPLLVIGAIGHALEHHIAAPGALGVAGLLLAALTAVKLAQPLGFDIGDRSKYQV
jgi:uncharacterized integral membrane protein